MRADLWMREQGCDCPAPAGLGAASSDKWYPEPYAMPGAQLRYCSMPWVDQGDSGAACYGTIVTGAPPQNYTTTPTYAQTPVTMPAPAPAPVPTKSAPTPPPAPKPAPAPAPAPTGQSGPTAAELALAQAQAAAQALAAAQAAAAAAKTQQEYAAAVAAARAAAEKLAAANAAAKATGSTVEISPGDATGSNFYSDHSYNPTTQQQAAPGGNNAAWIAIAAAIALAVAGGI